MGDVCSQARGVGVTDGSASGVCAADDGAVSDLRVALAELEIADDPACWEELGFVLSDRRVLIGGVAIRLGVPGSGIVGWSLHSGCPAVAIDGLPRPAISTVVPPVGEAHPNGARSIDHVVILTPDFDRTAAALARAGMPLGRIARNRGVRMGFRRLGAAVLELVQAGTGETGPARFWGLAIMVADLDALAARLTYRLGPIRPAVQPGHRIATLTAAAALTTKVAVMDATDR